MAILQSIIFIMGVFGNSLVLYILGKRVDKKCLLKKTFKIILKNIVNAKVSRKVNANKSQMPNCTKHK